MKNFVLGQECELKGSRWNPQNLARGESYLPSLFFLIPEQPYAKSALWFPHFEQALIVPSLSAWPPTHSQVEKARSQSQISQSRLKLLNNNQILPSVSFLKDHDNITTTNTIYYRHQHLFVGLLPQAPAPTSTNSVWVQLRWWLPPSSGHHSMVETSAPKS